MFLASYTDHALKNSDLKDTPSPKLWSWISTSMIFAISGIRFWSILGVVSLSPQLAVSFLASSILPAGAACVVLSHLSLGKTEDVGPYKRVPAVLFSIINLAASVATLIMFIREF